MNSSQNPFVSVLMTAYNREKYIAEAIESVLASTYKNFELIIVDDCSMDSTVEIAKRYAAHDNRIQLHENEKNLDQFPNRNKAAGYAKGELMMCVDSDDTVKPDGIAYIVEQFSKHPTVKFALVYGQGDMAEPTLFSSTDCVRNHFFKTNHLLVGPGGTVIRTAYFKEIGWFPTAYGPAGDCYYNIKAASNSDVLLLPYIFFNYRVHGEQEFFRKYSYLYNSYRYFEDVMRLPELPLSEKERKELLVKNKRKFLFSSLMYFKNTGDLRKTLQAYKIARVGVREIWTGLFQ